MARCLIVMIAFWLAAPAVTLASSSPAKPPVRVCGNDQILRGPAKPPRGAVVVPAGDNAALRPVAGKAYWFARGVHTLGSGPLNRINAADRNVFIGAPGAVLDGRRVNRYAFTGLGRNVVVKNLTIQNFGAVGANNNEAVVNHDPGRGWKIVANTIRGNAGSAVLIGDGNEVRRNCLTANGQYGFSAFEPDGVGGAVLDRNEISYNNTDDWERRQPGCGCSGAGKFWRTNRATVTRNWVHHNRGPGLWADTNNNDFLFARNYVNENHGPGIFYETSYNARIRANTLIRNALVAGPRNPAFPTGGIYISESGGDPRVRARYRTIEISDNRLEDNWSGVVLWENANRYCGSPGNAPGVCTLGNPRVANLSTCTPLLIGTQPYASDCRWRTQNVSVRDNRFVVRRARLSGCTTARACGLQGLFSNSGTIGGKIAFGQNNRFADNVYRGSWAFMAKDQGRVIGEAAWRAAPYGQDRGSRFRH